MSEHEHPAEDLEVEGSEAESVAGGLINHGPGPDGPAYSGESEMTRLMGKGYVEEACTTEGMLMVNRRTNHKVIVKL